MCEWGRKHRGYYAADEPTHGWEDTLPGALLPWPSVGTGEGSAKPAALGAVPALAANDEDKAQMGSWGGWRSNLGLGPGRRQTPGRLGA